MRKQKKNNYPKLAKELDAIGKVEDAKILMKRLIGSAKGANEEARKKATEEKEKAENQEEIIKNDFLRNLDGVGKKTALFGYGDLNYLVERELKIKPNDDSKTIGEKLENAAGCVQPAVRVSAYATRFPETGQQHYPFEEFGLLLYLVGEAGGKVGGAARSALDKAKKMLKEPETIASFIQGSPEVKNTVEEWILKAETEDSAG